MSEVNQTPVSYDDFVNGLKSKWNSFTMESEDAKTNKSAALRARKISMQLRTDLKNFREVSTENDKLIGRKPKD